MAENNVIIVRESHGTYALSGPPKCEQWPVFKKDDEEARFAVSSPNGRYFAVGNSSNVTVSDATNGNQTSVIRSRMLLAKFSPNGTYLIGWDNPSQNSDNYKIWALNGAKGPSVVHALKLSKYPEIQFSGDETVYARLTNHSILFATVPDFQVTAKKTPENMKIANFSLSSGQGPIHALCYIPATQGPSFARLYRYPEFETIIASKSFFQADHVEMKWNQKGTAVLLITYTDIDKTGKSYYGKTMLHYLDTKGTTATVQIDNDKDAPVIHAAEWSPNSTDFCVIIGKMPHTRASLFNSRCEIIFDMGISARNAIHFNGQGNLLLLGGFGNLAHGIIEIWELKKLKKKVAQLEAPATTQLQWLNDGVHFMTATTAPRMQIDNGFKVWDFTGKLTFEWKASKFLFGVYPFISNPPPSFPEEKLSDPKIGTKIIPSREETKKHTEYVPPHLRKKVGSAGALQPKSEGKSVVLTETEKKIKAVKKKLDQIKKLKELKSEGKPLEKNQLDKIETEESLIKEMEALELS